MSKKLKSHAQKILSLADVTIDGSKPGDIRVHNERFYSRVFSQGSLGLGEAYMDSWWDAEPLDKFFYKVLHAELNEKIKKNWKLLLSTFEAVLLNFQSKSRAFKVGEQHYDIGNDLYRAMLDKRMVYTCGYWKGAKTLDQAQEAKLDLVCRKIGLKKGDRVLDIGCGWGSFAKFAAEKYGAQVVGITISKEQVKLGREMTKGLPVEIRLQDYRDVTEKFDHIVSLGMFEHVGYKNYRTYFELIHRCLKDDGLFLLHTIGGNKSAKTTDPWIGKYIFPNSMLPSLKQISAATEGLFVKEDLHNFGVYYYSTLMAWFNNFDKHWLELKNNYNEKFYRMWKFYLLSCAAMFRSRQIQLWQIVFSKRGVPCGYVSIR